MLSSIKPFEGMSHTVSKITPPPKEITPKYISLSHCILVKLSNWNPLLNLQWSLPEADPSQCLQINSSMQPRTSLHTSSNTNISTESFMQEYGEIGGNPSFCLPEDSPIFLSCNSSSLKKCKHYLYHKHIFFVSYILLHLFNRIKTSAKAAFLFYFLLNWNRSRQPAE